MAFFDIIFRTLARRNDVVVTFPNPIASKLLFQQGQCVRRTKWTVEWQLGACVTGQNELYAARRLWTVKYRSIDRADLLLKQG